MIQISSSRGIVVLITFIQLVLMTDFMIIMPLGPDIVRDFHIPLEMTGLISGTYALTAALSAILLAPVLDRFDRRRALLLCLLVVMAAAIFAMLASDLTSMLAARAVAGFFGGPATSLALSVVIDNTPPQQRGKAMGQVMSAFSLAAVISVPLGLEIAWRSQWQYAFALISLLTLAAIALTALLPAQTKHMHHQGQAMKLATVLRNTGMRTGMAIVALATFSSFLLIPHLASYFQFNMNFPRKEIAQLYMAGGLCTWVVMNITGRLVDRLGAPVMSWIAMVLTVLVLLAGFSGDAYLPVIVIFVGFMTSNAVRNVSMQALVSQVPAPSQRAGFLAYQSATRHIFTGLAAALSSAVLVQKASSELENMHVIMWISVAATLLVPVLITGLNRHLHTRTPPVQRKPQTL